MARAAIGLLKPVDAVDEVVFRRGAGLADAHIDRGDAAARAEVDRWDITRGLGLGDPIVEIADGVVAIRACAEA